MEYIYKDVNPTKSGLTISNIQNLMALLYKDVNPTKSGLAIPYTMSKFEILLIRCWSVKICKEWQVDKDTNKKVLIGSMVQRQRKSKKTEDK